VLEKTPATGNHINAARSRAAFLLHHAEGGSGNCDAGAAQHPARLRSESQVSECRWPLPGSEDCGEPPGDSSYCACSRLYSRQLPSMTGRSRRCRLVTTVTPTTFRGMQEKSRPRPSGVYVLEEAELIALIATVEIRCRGEITSLRDGGHRCSHSASATLYSTASLFL
jgi:hypothetical protein